MHNQWRENVTVECAHRQNNGCDRSPSIHDQERRQDNRFSRGRSVGSGQPRGTAEGGEGGVRQPGQHAVVQGARRGRRRRFVTS